MNVGIEAEYWVIDETGALSSTEGLLDAHEQVTGEFVEPLIEIQTWPTDDEAELREDLQTVLESVLAVAETQGKGLAPLGTSLARESIKCSPDQCGPTRTCWSTLVLSDPIQCSEVAYLHTGSQNIGY
jgi:hypothetical protein